LFVTTMHKCLAGQCYLQSTVTENLPVNKKTQTKLANEN